MILCSHCLFHLGGGGGGGLRLWGEGGGGGFHCSIAYNLILKFTTLLGLSPSVLTPAPD